MTDRKHDSTSLTKNTARDIRVIKDPAKHDTKLGTIREILFFAPPLDSILGFGRYQILQGKRHSVMLWARKKFAVVHGFVRQSNRKLKHFLSDHFHRHTIHYFLNNHIYNNFTKSNNTAKCLSVAPLHPPQTRPWVPKSIEWRATQKKRQASAVSK